MHTSLLFLGLGGQEILLILVIFLLLFGARKIPELARGLGKGIREFKDASKDIGKDVEDSMKEPPRIKHESAASADPVSTPKTDSSSAASSEK